jgi:hypothetical protein
VRRAEAADTRGVDEHQPAGEQLAGQAHLGVAEQCLVVRVAGLRDVLHQLGGLHRDALGGALRLALAHQLGRGGLGVLDDGGHRGGDVVVHRAHRSVHQRVDQLALALLELAHDEHADIGVSEPLAGLEQAPAEVGTLVGGRCFQREVDQLDRCGNRHAGPSLLVVTCRSSI